MRSSLFKWNLGADERIADPLMYNTCTLEYVPFLQRAAHQSSNIATIYFALWDVSYCAVYVESRVTQVPTSLTPDEGWWQLFNLVFLESKLLRRKHNLFMHLGGSWYMPLTPITLSSTWVLYSGRRSYRLESVGLLNHRQFRKQHRLRIGCRRCCPAQWLR